MAEVDPIILQLRADVSKYRAELVSTTNLVDSSLKRQERAVISLERQMRASSAQIGGTLRGLAGSFAAAFSARQVAGIIDSYTRFQNQLKTAGIEGEQLAETQTRLFDIAQRYGVELEAIGTLYGRSAAAAKELNLNQAQQGVIAEATAAALKITGASAGQASGALLQLSQVLGGQMVQAEEYNSLIDGLRPLLQGVASGSDEWAGSVAKLTADVKAGNVTVSEFVTALLKGAPQVIENAASSTLTLSGAFTKLTNQLTIFVGQSAQTSGATAAIASGIELLADNLDSVADALAVVGAILVGRYAAGLAASAAGSVALTVATAGVTTRLAALGAVATATGRGLLAAFGGPVGLAVTALTLGIGYLASRTDDAFEATGDYATGLDASRSAQDAAREATDRLATAHGNERAELIASTKQLQANTAEQLRNAKAKLINARSDFLKAQETARASVTATKFASGSAAGPAAGMFIRGEADKQQREALANFKAARDSVLNLSRALDQISAGIAAPPASITPTGASPDKKKSKGKGADGRDPAEVARQVQDELARGGIEYAQINAELINSIEARRDAEIYRTNTEAEITARSIRADKDLSEAQKQDLLLLNEQIRSARIDLANAEELDRLNSEQAGILGSQLRAQQDVVAAQVDLATTAAERRDLEFRLLDLQEREERARLASILAFDSRATKEEKAAALAQYQTVGERYGLAREAIRRDNLGPVERYRESLNDPYRDVEAAVADKLEAVDDAITDGAAKVLGVEDPFLKSLIQIFLQQNVLKPLYDALNGAKGGGVGGIVSAIGGLVGLPGLATGGSIYVGGNSGVDRNVMSINGRPVARVNKGERIDVVPQGRAVRPAAGAVVPRVQSTIKNYNISVSADHSVTPAGFARELSTQILQKAAQMDVQVATGVLKAVPSRLGQYQNDGM